MILLCSFYGKRLRKRAQAKKYSQFYSNRAIAKPNTPIYTVFMHNAAYRHLKECLEKAITSQPSGSQSFDAQRIHRAVVDHMDALVSDNSTTSSVGHLFVSRFSQECPPLNQACSQGLQALGRAAFKWAMQQEDWTSAAWLMSFSGLCIPLPSPIHPHPKVLYALVSNDSMEWPAEYTAGLKDADLVARAMACDTPCTAHDEDTLSAQSRKYFSHIRKACYMGPGRGIFAVKAATQWLSLHHDDSPQSENLPTSMGLRHAHPDMPELSRLLQNEWINQQFWLTGDASRLDGLSGIDETDFQAWFWLLGALRKYDDKTAAKMPAWRQWWMTNLPHVFESAHFWMNLHTQTSGLDPTKLNKNERLLAVRDALALESRPPDGLYELPAEYREMPPALAVHPRER